MEEKSEGKGATFNFDAFYYRPKKMMNHKSAQGARLCVCVSVCVYKRQEKQRELGQSFGTTFGFQCRALGLFYSI